jgi:hypothetical protein
MITPAKERMRESRARRRLGLRPVQVLVSEQDIDFLLARHYESPARTTALSVRRCQRSCPIRCWRRHDAEGAMQKVSLCSLCPSALWLGCARRAAN